MRHISIGLLTLLLWFVVIACMILSMKNKMENNKKHTVGPVSKSSRSIIERGKINTIALLYVTTHFLGLVQALQ
jgi:hypothetical protein